MSHCGPKQDERQRTLPSLTNSTLKRKLSCLSKFTRCLFWALVVFLLGVSSDQKRFASKSLFNLAFFDLNSIVGL